MDLKQKMEDWGPWGEKENKVLIFSLGNEYEGHGPALPKDTDSRIAKFVAQKLAHETGQRYCAHIPFQTDGVGSCASYWMADYRPKEECAKEITKFINDYLNRIKNIYPKFEKILIINAHGGNNGIEAYLNKEDFPVPVIVKFAAELNINEIVDYMIKVMKKPVSPEREQEMRRIIIGHADDFEHTVGDAIGIVDHDKLKQLNQDLAKNFEETLRKYPVLGGLGGYIEFGDEKFEVLRKEKKNLVACYQKFKKDRKIELFTELEEAIIKFSMQRLKDFLYNEIL